MYNQEGYKRREQQTIQRTINECEEKHNIKTEKMEEQHNREIARYTREMDKLRKGLIKQQQQSKDIEQDFQVT